MAVKVVLFNTSGTSTITGSVGSTPLMATSDSAGSRTGRIWGARALYPGTSVAPAACSAPKTIEEGAAWGGEAGTSAAFIGAGSGWAGAQGNPILQSFLQWLSIETSSRR
ncbi:hypothetical protein METHPM2_410034 [Pseudomonas sp. PM2]